MKNKKGLYILIPAVLIIWGIIFYRIFSNTSFESPKTIAVSDNSRKDTTLAEKDTFFIYADYSDPFLKSYKGKGNESDEAVNKKENSEKTRNFRRRRVVSQRTRWPEITYNGLIYNKQNNRYVILLGINKKRYLFHKGDTIQNIYLRKFSLDSIYVVYKNDEKTIAKNKG